MDFGWFLKKQKEEMAKSKEELVESGSGSEHIEGASGNEQEAEQQPPPPKGKRYHRHTARQIQEMESCVSLSLSLIKIFF